MKYKSLNLKAIESWWSNLPPDEQYRVLTSYIPMLDGLIHDRFTGKYHKLRGVLLSSYSQISFDQVIRFLISLRGLGTLAPQTLFKAYRTKKEYAIDETIQWKDPKSPLSFWNADPVAAIGGSENEGTSNITTLVRLEASKSILLMSDHLLIEVLSWMSSNRVKLVKSVAPHDKETVKVQLNSHILSITNVIEHRRLSLIYLGGKRKSVTTKVIGSFNSAGG